MTRGRTIRKSGKDMWQDMHVLPIHTYSTLESIYVGLKDLFDKRHQC